MGEISTSHTLSSFPDNFKFPSPFYSVAVWFCFLTTGTIGCFFVFSLLFLFYVYIKAFVGRGILQIGKSIKIFFVIGGICSPAFGMICTYLDYSNMEEKQGRDRATVIEGNPNNTIFFTELGAYILNMEGAGTITYIQYGAIIFFSVAAVFIGFFIFFRFVELSLTVSV